jgi:hypothetical protein
MDGARRAAPGEPLTLRGICLCGPVFSCLALAGATGSAAPAGGISPELEGLRSQDPIFYPGERTEGVPLETVLRRSDSAEYVSFVYGDCVPESDAGCAPPFEIQVWPACRRHLALYGSSSGPDLDRVAVRGVPAAVLDGGTRLELQTGRSTIVVFADTRQRLSRIAQDLRSLDGRTASGVPLPPPDPGAVDGRLAC